MSMAAFVTGSAAKPGKAATNPCMPERDNFDHIPAESLVMTVVVLGASGDLAKKKTYPALYALYSRG